MTPQLCEVCQTLDDDEVLWTSGDCACGSRHIVHTKCRRARNLCEGTESTSGDDNSLPEPRGLNHLELQALQLAIDVEMERRSNGGGIGTIDIMDPSTW